MQLLNGRLVISPSDLNDYVECPHLTGLSLEVAQDVRPRPHVPSEQNELLRRKGQEHEAAYLARLRQERREVVEIAMPDPWDFEAGSRATVEAMRAASRSGSPRWLAGELLEYRRREARPAWWWFFERRDQMSLDDLVDDAESLGKLEPTGAPPIRIKQSLAHRLRLPAQQHKFALGDTPVDPATKDRPGRSTSSTTWLAYLRFGGGPASSVCRSRTQHDANDAAPKDITPSGIAERALWVATRS